MQECYNLTKTEEIIYSWYGMKGVKNSIPGNITNP